MRPETEEVAWEDADTRRLAQRRLISPVIGLILTALGIALVIVTATMWWHIESVARWLVILGVGIAVGALIASVFGLRAYLLVRGPLRQHPWRITTLHFDPELHPRDVRLVQSPRHQWGQTTEEAPPPNFRADFPGNALERMKGATVRLPVCGEGGTRVVSLDASARNRSRLGILRPHPLVAQQEKQDARQAKQDARQAKQAAKAEAEAEQAPDDSSESSGGHPSAQ